MTEDCSEALSNMHHPRCVPARLVMSAGITRGLHACTKTQAVQDGGWHRGAPGDTALTTARAARRPAGCDTTVGSAAAVSAASAARAARPFASRRSHHDAGPHQLRRTCGRHQDCGRLGVGQYHGE